MTKEGRLFFLVFLPPAALSSPPVVSQDEATAAAEGRGGAEREAGVLEDQRWQVYLLTPTSGDVDTNPARSAPLCLEAL